MSSDERDNLGKLPQDPVVIGNPERTKADFSYSMTPVKARNLSPRI
jgi:hypothetical protein